MEEAFVCSRRRGIAAAWLLDRRGKGPTLGQLAVEAGLKVAWFSLEELGVLVRRHRADDSVTRAVQAILSARLIVVDDYRPAARQPGCR